MIIVEVGVALGVMVGVAVLLGEAVNVALWLGRRYFAGDPSAPVAARD